jgi:hypothetical protein
MKANFSFGSIFHIFWLSKKLKNSNSPATLLRPLFFSLTPNIPYIDGSIEVVYEFE